MRKALVAEFVGTFVIVFFPVALAADYAVQQAHPGLLLSALVSGLPVAAMIFAVGAISGAHFNPAVTLGLTLAGKFSWKQLPAYFAVQFTGASTAAAAALLAFGRSAGAHLPSHPSHLVQNLGVEVLLGFMLMTVIFGAITLPRLPAWLPASLIGTAVIVGVLIGGPITGGSMNPARSLGPAIFEGGDALAQVWLYVLAPTLGAALAAVLYIGVLRKQSRTASN